MLNIPTLRSLSIVFMLFMPNIATGIAHAQDCVRPIYSVLVVRVEDTPGYMAFGDLDGDGDLDIITSNQLSNDISVLMNNSNGTFMDPISYPVGQLPEGISLGDLDGDNALDIVISNAFSDNVSVHLNRCPPPTKPCLADLSGDGELNFFDVSGFLLLFQLNDPIADFNGDGEFNFFDVSAFLSAFAEGCP